MRCGPFHFPCRVLTQTFISQVWAVHHNVYRVMNAIEFSFHCVSGPEHFRKQSSLKVVMGAYGHPFSTWLLQLSLVDFYPAFYARPALPRSYPTWPKHVLDLPRTIYKSISFDLVHDGTHDMNLASCRYISI
jgi:hypothetical protein